MHLAGMAASGALMTSAWGCLGRPPPNAKPAMTTSQTQTVLQQLGVNLYTLRDLMAQDAGKTLEAVAATGYETVETAGLYGIPAEDFRQLTDRCTLRCPAGHYPFEAHEEDPRGVISTARTLGQQYVVWPWLPPHYRETADDYRRTADRLNEAGRRFSEADLQFAYHNHDFEFERLEDGATGYDLLLERTDPQVVSFELDVYWMYKGGYDPLNYIRQYPGRIPLMHFKDGTAAPEKKMVDVGEGVIDFSAILARAGEAGLQYAFVEHDHPEEPLESIRASYEHLQEIMM